MLKKKLPELLIGKNWIKIAKQILRYIQSENFFLYYLINNQNNYYEK